MLKIGYLTKRKDSCWWLRVLNPMSHLNLAGHECEDETFESQLYCQKCMTENKPCGPYEISWDHETAVECPGCKEILSSLDDVKKWRENIFRIIESKDIIAFQRPTEVSHLRLMRKAKEMGKKIVQIADDDYINVPTWNTGYQYYTQRRGIIEESLKIVDAIDVTTPYLQKLYLGFNKRVEVLPNSLDIEIIDVSPRFPDVPVFDRAGQRLTMEQVKERREGKKFILWGGSPTHEKDLEIIVGAARRITRSENVVFGFVGYVHRLLLEVIPVDRLFLFSLVPCMQYFSLYQTIKPDIGLAPVADVPFNYGKSNLKAIEQSVLYSLPVMSDLVTYKDCVPRGIYCKNDEFSWYSGMRQAINMGDEERVERVTANRKHVEENYDIKNNVVLWERFYESL